ncbi:MAG: hypothetical protein ACM3ML_37860 [Micromonosporaceae bacterium]
MCNGIGPLISELQNWGITVIVATLTPCYGYGSANTNVTDACTTTTRSTTIMENCSGAPHWGE